MKAEFRPKLGAGFGGVMRFSFCEVFGREVKRRCTRHAKKGAYSEKERGPVCPHGPGTASVSVL